MDTHLELIQSLNETSQMPHVAGAALDIRQRAQAKADPLRPGFTGKHGVKPTQEWQAEGSLERCCPEGGGDLMSTRSCAIRVMNRWAPPRCGFIHSYVQQTFIENLQRVPLWRPQNWAGPDWAELRL